MTDIEANGGAEMAHEAYRAGMCPIPILGDGSKKPAVRWEEYQNRRPTEDEMKQWFGPHRAAAVVCGPVSGGLVMIEMEGANFEAGSWQRFRDAAAGALGADRWAEITGCVEMSPSGGPHLFVRCTETTVGNLKLARRPVTLENGKPGVQVIMETRGKGGYTVIAGSVGHKSGQPWTSAKGTYDDIVTVTAEELHAVLDAARTLDEMPQRTPKPPAQRDETPRWNGTSGDSVFQAVVDDYNRRTSWDGVLAGIAEFAYQRGSVTYWHRVGSDNEVGMTTNATGRDTLIVFSTSTAFDSWDGTGKAPSYDRFSAHAVLAHGGDRTAAYEALRERGHGPAKSRPAVQVDPFGRDTPPPGIDPETGEILEELDDGTPPPWVLPESFWEARPSLSHIRQAAHSRIRSADLVFHGTLARLSAYTPHNFELPALAGAAGSLNYFTIAVGPSGAGKSSGSSIADELLPRRAQVEDKPLGSGEGLAENYMGTVTEEDENGKKRQQRRQVLHNVFVYGDEGAALTEMMQRKGATLPEALRRAWTGGALGQSNATTERTRVIPAGNYRLGLLIGFQPEVAAQLMGDAIAGTPQRFTWAWASDGNIPDPADIPDWPGELDVPEPAMADVISHTITRGGYRRVQLGVAADIRAEVIADAVQRARGEVVGPALDSHAPLHLLKVAGLLALLEGRIDIDNDDWALAHVVWDTSRAVRQVVEHAVAAETERQEGARIDFHARREGAAEAARSGAQDRVARIALNVARWVHDHPLEDGYTRAQLGRRIAGRDRHLLDVVLDRALSREWLVETELGTFAPSGNRPEV
jgi:hypothetical protein